MRQTRSILPALLLLIATLLGCASGTSGEVKAPALATRLEYANPPSSPSEWRIEVDSGQGTSRLVLKLLGPSGLRTKGVSFFLTCQGPQPQWLLTQPGAALDLGAEPRLFRAKQGTLPSDLQVGIYQKAGMATLGQAPLALLTIELKAGSAPGSIALTQTAGVNSVYLHENGQILAMSPFQIGTLSAR